MDKYGMVRLVFPRNKNIEEALGEVIMTFHDEDVVVDGFGEVDPPYFDSFEDEMKDKLAAKVKELGQDILIEYLLQTDEGDLSEFYIFKSNGTYIEGPSIDAIYGCSFEYSNQDEDEDDEDEDYEEDFLDDDRIENMMEKCSIELHAFCQLHQLNISEAEALKLLSHLY